MHAFQTDPAARHAERAYRPILRRRRRREGCEARRRPKPMRLAERHPTQPASHLGMFHTSQGPSSVLARSLTPWTPSRPLPCPCPSVRVNGQAAQRSSELCALFHSNIHPAMTITGPAPPLLCCQQNSRRIAAGPVTSVRRQQARWHAPSGCRPCRHAKRSDETQRINRRLILVDCAYHCWRR